MKKFHIYGIKWDIDEGYDPVLPSEVVISLDTEELDVEEYISDWLSDTFGWCHMGFLYEEMI